MRPKSEEPIERLTIKLPKSLATYFRKAFPHGKRSQFVAKALLDYKHQQEIETMEDQLRAVARKRN